MLPILTNCMEHDSQQLKQQLAEALKEIERLKAENNTLSAKLKLSSPSVFEQSSISTEIIPNEPSSHFSVEEKIYLFRSLLKGREDVYPIRWDNKKTGKSGYSPACGNEWVHGICNKPRVKCSDCSHQKFLPVTDQVIYEHLAGKKTIGVYPLLENETCHFVAADFDKENWFDDARAYFQICREYGVDALLERSRSGKGGHVWIFFEQPISASMARRLASYFLTKAMEKRHQLGLSSYDRLFPSQDTIPKGGFGNLIALPLQKEPRSHGNSTFIDEKGNLYEDPWAVLKKVKKINEPLIRQILQAVQFQSELGEITLVPEDEESCAKPWKKPKELAKSKKIGGPFPKKVHITLANMVYIEKHGLPTAMLNRLLRIAAFQNPEFYRAQALRLSTYDKPRIISCGEDFPNHVALPRGCLHDVLSTLKDHHIKPELLDERFLGKHISVKFKGELRDLQKDAVAALSQHDIGVLSATTAFGKTVVASWMIAKRKTNTLILVHRKQLMDQWKEQLAMFLELPPKSLGEIGGGKSKATGIIDIATMQSLHREGQVKSNVAEYGHVIIDECHHVSAFSFEQVLKQVKAKYVLGLTATPVRKDGHHPIITMQCGPIRFKASAQQQTALNQFQHLVIPRYTDFYLSEIHQKMSIQEIYGQLVQDKNRNDLIVDDLRKVLEAKRSPLILTERTEHLDDLEKRLSGCVKNIFVLRGGMGKKQRQELQKSLANLPDSEERVLLATGRYIGEGFDDSRLDTLFLVSPVSWKGTLQQYVGRLHRSHAGKKLLQVYDYVDCRVPVLHAMFKKRLKGYKAIGYSLNESVEIKLGNK